MCGLILVGATATGRPAEIVLPGNNLTVEFSGEASEAAVSVATQWLQRAAQAVAVYYGGFPVRKAVVRITWTDGRRVSRGQAFGDAGPLVKIRLGREVTSADLEDDWMLTHELVHLTFPSVAARHHWVEEGLATYVEPIARVRAGQTPVTQPWSEMVDGMPKGQPAPGDKGLDVTHTWGRTYWGGALFFLRVDVEIRRRTQNRFGLEHALRAILNAGGTIETMWMLDRICAVGDAATGVPVLRELYDEMKATPVTVDLPALWKELGVVPRGKTMEFDDSAPLAAVRKAITARAAEL